MKWYDSGIKFSIVIGGALSLLALSIAVPQLYVEYSVKMRSLEVIEKAVEKGLEIRLNGDLLKGVELVKIENK